MSEWKETKLTEITSKIGDGLHGTPKYDKNGDYFFINGNNLSQGKIIIKSGTKKINEVEYYKHSKPIDEKTILLSINGTIGNLAVYNNEKCILGKSACYINLNDKVDKQFIYYHFLNRDFQAYIIEVATGTTIPNVPLKGIREYSLDIPPLPEQKAIAEVLSSLDDKIDLLHRQNKTLEQMSEMLFRQWFVEEADESWVFNEIKDYVSVVDNRGKTPPNRKDETSYPLIEVNALGKENRLVDYSVIRKYVDKETFENWFRNNPKKYDTLLSTVGSIGAISMYLLEKGNVAQNVIGLSAKGISSLYLFQILKYKTNEILQLDIGGVQPSIKVPHLLSLTIPIPPKDKQIDFDEQVIQFVHKMEINYNQIRNLGKIRDTLLPKLMSGKVRIEI